MIRADDRRNHVLWPKRLAWLVILWVLGVAVLGAAVIAIKLVMGVVGFTT